MSEAPNTPHYQMLWDCATCGANGLLGQTHRHCPQCGAAQDPKRRYFPPPGTEIEAKDHRYVGVDWHCSYCDTPNSASAAFCGNCGAPKDGAAPVGLVQDAKTPPAPPPAPAARGGGWGKFVWMALLLVSVVLGYFALRTHTEQVVVMDKTWQREVDVERFTPLSQTQWCDSLPSDAYQVSRSRAQRSTRAVPDGQDCHEVRMDAGDGTFTKRQECTPRHRQEPIYDDQCHYRVNRWQVQRTDRLQGQARQNPAWPMPTLAPSFSGGGGGLGAERLGPRRETYRVVLQASSSKKQWTCDVPAAAWTQWGIEQSMPLQVRGTGGADCASLLLNK